MTKWHISKDDSECTTLKQVDPELGHLIKLIGDVTFELRPNRFQSLVRSIIGQLISVSAANAIFNRLLEKTGDNMTAEQIACLSDETILACGFSKRKLSYLRMLQKAVQTGELDLKLLDQEDDQTVIKQLTNIKGIGVWTAQMFLIFTLQRPDVLAVDDIGLQRGARWLYQTDPSERRSYLAQKQAVWSPYSTIASIYLWEAVQLGWVKQYTTIKDVTLTHTYDDN